MGGSSSKTQIKTLNEMVATVIAENISKSTAASSQNQNIRIKNVGGDVVIRDVTMGQSNAVTLTSIQEAVNDTEFVNKITNDFKQQAHAQSQAFIGVLGKAESESITDITNRVVTSIKNSNIHECLVNNFQDQSIEVEDVQNNVIIEGVALDQIQQVSQTCSNHVLNAAKVTTEYDNIIEQAAEAKQENPLDFLTDLLGMPLMILAGGIAVAVIVVVIIIVAAKAGGGGGGDGGGELVMAPAPAQA